MEVVLKRDLVRCVWKWLRCKYLLHLDKSMDCEQSLQRALCRSSREQIGLLERNTHSYSGQWLCYQTGVRRTLYLTLIIHFKLPKVLGILRDAVKVQVHCNHHVHNESTGSSIRATPIQEKEQAALHWRYCFYIRIRLMTALIAHSARLHAYEADIIFTTP